MYTRAKSLTTLLCLSLLSLPSFSQNSLKIEDTILKDDKSFYYINFKDYPTEKRELPIGVFDSGTGGLTVLDALLNFDSFKNLTKENKPDQELDFKNENFIYLADQANMPYGNYNATNKDDLLREHIIKDVQFLLGTKSYETQAKNIIKPKDQVKAIVVACNTATAYGYNDMVSFMSRTGQDIPVIGVINAAAQGTLTFFNKEEKGSIGVFATVGTIASNGYERTLKDLMHREGFKNIQIYNQGGFGLAEAVDEEVDFINVASTKLRDNYRGPSLSNPNYKIDLALKEVYNFNFEGNKMICDNENVDDCSDIQINDTENYVRYHLVTLLEKMKHTKGAYPLKALILGCTHYPYLVKEINTVLTELRNYQDVKGSFRYKDLLNEKVELIDPSIYVAQELYLVLQEKDLLKKEIDNSKASEFYISVPNLLNKNVQVDQNGKFTYDYKYGREAGDIQEYVQVVPFDHTNISVDTFNRFKKTIPQTYRLIEASLVKQSK